MYGNSHMQIYRKFGSLSWNAQLYGGGLVDCKVGCRSNIMYVQTYFIYIIYIYMYTRMYMCIHTLIGIHINININIYIYVYIFSEGVPFTSLD